MTTNKPITIHAIVDDKPVTRAEVQRWEARRASRVLRKIAKRLGPHGLADILPTTGGSPIATRFLVDYTETDAISIPVHDDYPVQIAGRAVLDDGFGIGGVRHQFREHDGAMEALLTVEFPALFPSTMIAAHRWHLAAEFSNWIVASRRDAA